MKDISVIIVSWNAKDYLDGCLASVQACSQRVLEVIVVDNASSDGSAAMVRVKHPHVRLIESPENLGFARANNLALRAASGSLVAFVNSDVVLHEGCLDELARFHDTHADCGLAGPRVVGRDGHVQGTCRRLPNAWNILCRTLAIDLLFPRVPFLSGHEMRHFRHDRLVDAEVLSGCFWLAKRSAVDAVGPLDDRYFFYMEDVDWCRRFHQDGWRVSFVPEATALHFGGASSANAPLKFCVQYHRANQAYWAKYKPVTGEMGYRFLAVVHHGIRLAARLLRRVVGLGSSAASRHKVAEDLVCLRWLLTGTDISGGVRPSNGTRRDEVHG